MYNLDDNNVSQIIKYKANELELYNRNFLSSDDKPLGYNKIPKTYLRVERKYQDLISLQNKDKTYYTLSWDLYLDENNYQLLMNIYNDYLLDIKNDIESAINIYEPTIFIGDKLQLVDNRVVDLYTGVYKTYNIVITNIDNITEYFFNSKYIKISMEAETI